MASNDLALAESLPGLHRAAGYTAQIFDDFTMGLGPDAVFKVASLFSDRTADEMGQTFRSTLMDFGAQTPTMHTFDNGQSINAMDLARTGGMMAGFAIPGAGAGRAATAVNSVLTPLQLMDMFRDDDEGGVDFFSDAFGDLGQLRDERIIPAARGFGNVVGSMF